jgi:predicted RNase H-like nuclease (RuvC/YqgF family)
MQKVIDKLRTT